MKISILLLLLSLIIHAAPIGICLHSYSPEAANDKIESIEFEKIEKDQQGTWVYPANHRAILITKYRYRGTIVYIDKMTPDHPEFERYLKYYEDNATQIPSTRRFLNPKIIAMRELASAYDKQKAEYDKLPQITIGGKNYKNPKLIKFEGGNMYISHKDGNAKFDVNSFTDKEIDLLREIEPSFKSFNLSLIGGHRLWNSKYEGIENGSIQIIHEKGVTEFDVDSITEKDIETIKSIAPSFKNVTISLISGRKLWNAKYDGIKQGTVHIIHEKGDLTLHINKISDEDKKTISSWSDGTWKIALPGFYEYSENQKSYKELVLESGKFHSNVTLQSRDREVINFKCTNGRFSYPIQQVVKLNGIFITNRSRLEKWVDEIILEKFAKAESEEKTEVVSEDLFPDGDLVVKDVAVKILQVLDKGVLASAFVGDLQKGTMVVKIETKKVINHPITNEKIVKTIEVKQETQKVVERITDDYATS